MQTLSPANQSTSVGQTLIQKIDNLLNSRVASDRTPRIRHRPSRVFKVRIAKVA